MNEGCEGMGTEPRRISMNRIMIVYVLGIFLLQPLFWMSPEHEAKIRNAFLWPAVFTAFCAILYAVWKNPKNAGRLAVSLLLPVWLLITNTLNGDPYLLLNQKFIMGVFLTFGVCFPVFILAEPGWLARGLKATGWFAVLLFAGIACIGVFLAFTGRTYTSPLSDRAIGIFDGRLYVFTLHPNEVACLFVGVLFWAAYLIAAARRPLSRVLLAAACLCLYAGIALTDSTTGKLSTSVGLGLTVMLLLKRYGRGKNPLKAVYTVIIACAVAVIAMAGFSGVVRAASYALRRPKPALTIRMPEPIVTPVSQEREQSVDMPNSIESEGEPSSDAPDSVETKTEPSSDMPDSVEAEALDVVPVARDMRPNFGTFSDRTSIWKAGLDAIRNHPRILLMGMTDGQAARVPKTALNRDIYHMHNAWMEMLLLGGIPGLLLYVLFCVQLVAQCVKVYFNKKQPFSTRMLAIGPAVLLIHCLMEIYPAFAGTAMDMVFALLAGAFTAMSRHAQRVPTDGAA